MEMRNRMPDVAKLRGNACQEFLKMVIKPNWQQRLYDIAKEAIEHNRYADNYRPAYEKMRDIGIENYSIDEMDVTFITQVVCFCSSIVSVQKQTKDALTKLRDDRNLTNHSNENEEDEELYLRGLLSLCNLRSFVKAVDKFEINIDDADRLNYRNKYIPQIEELMDILDEERIALIQRTKDITKDINRLLSCSDDETRLRMWCDISKLYMDREWKLDKNPERYNEFIVMASDAGIPEAHINAAIYFLNIKKDYVEMERRLQMMFDSRDRLTAGNVHSIIESINWYVTTGNNITVGMNEMADRIIALGFPVEKQEDGTYLWKRRQDA
jgi:tetratricopeptide (TPR) repeat protein|nr:MAG TPA: hypothetical protein [Caudoviricetes sp.]